MADFYERTGKMALGSRLRRLSDQITEQAASIYTLYQVDLQPKWFPVFYALSGGEGRSIMDIAREIGHSHPSVSQIVREMQARGYVRNAVAGKEATPGPGRMTTARKEAAADGRKNFVMLSPEGLTLWDKMQPQFLDVQAAIERTMRETDHDLWRAIGEWEFLLEQKSLLRRVQEEKKTRESHQVQIIGYIPAHRNAFRQLNEEWITKYFHMEESDYKSLDHPQENIIGKGGYIFMAMLDGQPVGTCALIPMHSVTLHSPAIHPTTIHPAANASITPDPVRNQHIDDILDAYPGQTHAPRPASPGHDGKGSADPHSTGPHDTVASPADTDSREPAPAPVFELAKMGVSPLAQGKGIGFLLGQACIEKARSLGAEKIYLESNTRLKPAISLYHKLGFRKVAGPPSPYERCDIQMELKL
ncbi:MAG TPA: GNAT family N-acetyltransferase [Puia sp.]|nr:GNAT family N-acetyltransferase [Puia sp.]